MSERRFELGQENIRDRVAAAIERSYRVREESESVVRKSRERRAHLAAASLEVRHSRVVSTGIGRERRIGGRFF